MRFSIEWLDDATNAAPEERATVADLRVLINDQNACHHMVGDRVENHVTIALHTLAYGLAQEWWTIFGGRDGGVSLFKHRGGYLVPDIRFSFDGAAFEVSSQQRTYPSPVVQFWNCAPEVLTRPEAEGVLSGFVEQVVTRLTGRGAPDASAVLRWDRVKRSLADPEEAAFCEAAGALGLDPYRIDDRAADAIERAATLFEGESLTELLAGARGVDRHRLLEWVEHVEQRPDGESRIAELRGVADQVAAATPKRAGERPWSLGYRRARATRRALGLHESSRIDGDRALASRLGGRSFSAVRPVDGILALRSDRGGHVHIHLRTVPDPSARIFAFARGVGDAVCFPETGRSPVNGLHMAYRQAAGRAFAAEFLAPIQEIRNMIELGRDPDAIAGDLGVWTDVIERQIENADRIDEACASA